MLYIRKSATVFLILLELAWSSTSKAQSTINPAVPASCVGTVCAPLSSAVVRNNFAAAANDVNSILSTIGTIRSTVWPVSLGGTGYSYSSGSSLDAISGFSGTGFLNRTGGGTYSFSSATNGITLGNIAQIGANTVLGNATSGTANVSAMSVSGCSSASSALIWTTNSGFGCNTSITATTNANLSGVITSSGNTTSYAATAPAGSLLGNTTGSTAAPSFSSTPVLGKSGTLGSVTFGNATSGLLTLQPTTGALGTVTVSIPAATDTLVNLASSQVLTNKSISDTQITGTTTQVQYVDSTGYLGGDSTFTFNDTTKQLASTSILSGSTIDAINAAGNAVITANGLETSGGGSYFRSRDSVLGTVGYMGQNSAIVGGTAYSQFDIQAAQAGGTLCLSSNGHGSTTASTNCDILLDASDNVAVLNNLTVSGTTTVASVRGGTAAGSTLTLESTSGTGTSDSILFKTGSQATAMTVGTSGLVGIGAAPSTYQLKVVQAGGNQAYFGSTGANTVSQVTIDNGGGNYYSILGFFDAGASKWQFFKDPGHAMHLQDTVNGKDFIIAIPTGGLGLGASQTTTVAQNGDMQTGRHFGYAGSSPTVTAGATYCGTSPSVIAGSTDFAGRVTVGSSTNGGVCPIVFANAPSVIPACVANDETTGILVRWVPNTTTGGKITGVIVAGDVLSWHCIGQPN